MSAASPKRVERLECRKCDLVHTGDLVPLEGGAYAGRCDFCCQAARKMSLLHAAPSCVVFMCEDCAEAQQGAPGWVGE